MKKKDLILLFLTAFMLISCSAQRQIYREKLDFADFRRYTSENFIISPAYTGYTYQPVGELTLTFDVGYRPTALRPNVPTTGMTELRYGRASYRTGKGTWFHPTKDYMIQQLVEKAKEVGANGILDFKAVENRVYKKGKGYEVISYTLTGFAVKITE